MEDSSKVIHAFYTDDDVLMAAVKKVRAERYHIEEIYTPFPVHGLDKAMGLAPTRLAITSFIYGVLGLVENPDVRTTDEHFLMEISAGANVDEQFEILRNTGAVEITLIDKAH